MKFAAVRLGSVALAIAGCFALQSFAMGKGELFVRLIFLAGLYVTLSVSLNLINGITGQFSIGHAAFYMVGAYASGYMTNNYAAGWGLKGPMLMLVLMLMGALMAAIAGLIVGLPSLRLRSAPLAARSARSMMTPPSKHSSKQAPRWPASWGRAGTFMSPKPC